MSRLIPFPAIALALTFTFVTSSLSAAESQENTLVVSPSPNGAAVEKTLAKGEYRLFANLADNCPPPTGGESTLNLRFNRALPIKQCSAEPYLLKVRVAGDIQFNFDTAASTVTLKLIPKKTAAKPFTRPLPEVQCPSWKAGEPVTVQVSPTFKEGETLRDFYSGHLATVSDGKITLIPATGSNGMLLLELAEHQPTAFSWDNLTVYFIMTDRFNNGDTSNDAAFGRKKDGKDEIGTFHGGDIKGVTAKLDYIQALGANAIWMTPLVEQVHGFVGGGKNGDFPFYAYHGYWALDYTKLDPNFGTDDDLRELVREAHKRGIRLIWDAVINHAGYATGQDLVDFEVDVFNGATKVDNNWQPGTGENWHSYHQHIDYQSLNWNKNWWSAEWVRGTFPGYRAPGGDDLTLALAGLPDFITESTEPVKLPPILANKTDTRAQNEAKAVIEHVIDWQAYWVREFGIDAFRSDTAKHVELNHWQSLKDAAAEALKDWQAANPEAAFDDEFWMVGEVFDHPLFKNYYYDYGFDSLINFDFQKQAHDFALCLPTIDTLFQRYADEVNTDSSFNALTYISSHDTTLFYAKYQNLELQKRVAAALLLLPGGVQLYYGDESGRALGPYGDDFHQGTRSDMNWNQLAERADLLSHWQKLGQFRNRHAAIGAGQHQKLADIPYTFSRTSESDRVVISFAGNEQP